MSGGSLAPDEGVLEWRKSSLERRDCRSEGTLRVSPQEEQPQGRPRVRSLDKDSFFFEQEWQEKNEKREVVSLLRKGCSGDWREVLCAWERRAEEVEGEGIKMYP